MFSWTGELNVIKQALLGNEANPTRFEPLLYHIARSYPEKKIDRAHMGLSKELSTMSPA